MLQWQRGVTVGCFCVSPSLQLLPSFSFMRLPHLLGLTRGRERAKEAGRKALGGFRGHSVSGSGRCFQLTLLTGSSIGLPKPPVPTTALLRNLSPPISSARARSFCLWLVASESSSGPRPSGGKAPASFCQGVCLSRQESWVGSRSSPHCLSHLL